MAYTHDIPFDESNRANRRRSNPDVKSLQKNLIQTKALPKIGDLRFDPNAEDGDGDGLVQDNTPYERPAIIKPSLPRTSGLASLTGNTLFTSSGSWTQGLTNEEVAERAIPDNMADLMNMIQQLRSHTGDDNHPYMKKYTDEQLLQATFDPKAIGQMREALTRALDDRPDWRSAIDEYGMPPIAVIDDSELENSWGGMMHGANLLSISLSSVKKKGGFFDKRNNTTGQELFAGLTGAPYIPEIKHNLVGSGSVDDTLVHEWGHYINYLAMKTHPDSQTRELARYLYLDKWESSPGTSPTRGTHLLAEFFKDKAGGDSFFGMASAPEGEFDLPDDDEVPFVKSVYATTKPVEFFAEATTSYFSPDKKYRNLSNDAAKGIVEQVLGRRGLRSQSQPPKRATGSALFGLSPEEIAERVVPRSWEDARDLVEEHWYQLATPEQMQLPREEVRNIIDKAMKEIFENDAGWDNIDFHPDQVATLEAKLVETFYNNPDYYEAVQRLGMPPVFFTSDKAKKVWPRGTLAAAMGDHFPMIAINPEEFERERLKGPRGNKRPLLASIFGGVGINGTKQMVTDPSYESTLVHEWGHYVNKLAAFIHPDEEVRKIGQAYWHMSYGDLTFLEDNDSAIFRYADDIMNAQLGGNDLDPEVPFILTHYGQSTPAETFAEGITAMLSGDKRKRDLVSPGLQKDIRKVLGLPEEEDTLDVIRGERRGLASHSSSARVVKRRSNGTREFRSEWSPISGSDWLKDATFDEIAEAVIPTSEDDAVTMMTQLLCYGQIPANANEVRAMKAMARDLLRESFGRTAWDYSPQMRATQKDTLIRAMEESPGFEYIVRMYGLPPIIGVSPGSGAKMRATSLQDANGNYIDVGSFHQPSGRFTMGATLQNMVIGMNYDADAMKMDLPSGFIDMAEMMRLTGTPGSMRSDGVSISTGRTTTMIDNFGLSRMDTLRHEYAHWFWYYHMGSPYTYGQANSSRGQQYGLPDLGKGRSDRALFISKATGESAQQVLDRINGLKWRFDEERITVRSQRNRIQRDLEILGYVSVDPVTRMASVEPHPDAPTSMGGNGGPDGTTLWQATMGRFINHMNNPKGGDIWSSEDTALFDAELSKLQDAFTGTSDYSSYPLPLIRGVYANATAQETFAEMLNLFLSPDNEMFKRYATDSMLDAIAEGFNFERTESGILTPWGARNLGPKRGLASRNANESLLSRTLSTNDRLAVSAKPDADITPSTVTQKAPGVYSFSTGDDKWDFLVGEDMGKQWDTAYASWVSNGGQDRMRQASASLMGIGSMSPADRDESRGSMIDAFVTMSHISTNGEPTPSASYRALALVNSDSEILTAEVGKPLALPLTSFSPDREVHMEIRRQRTGIDDKTKDTGSTVIMRLAPNAQVVKPSKDHDRTFRNSDGDTVTDSREYLTQGQFKITGRQTLSDGTVLVDIEHTHVFDAETGKTKRLRGIASADTNPLASTRDKHLETLDANIKEREDYISRVERALDEWNRLGVWNGGDYGVVVNPNAQPNNITREQMLARNYNPDDFAGQAKERIDTLKTGLDIMKESRERVKSQPDTTTSIESILEDPETLARIQKRAQEVTAMSRAERGELFTDGEYQYVVHWGADTLENGVIDPSRSRGDENTLSTVGNTRRINKVTAQQLVADRDDTRQKLQDLTKLQQEFERTGLVDLSSTDNPFAISSMIGAAVQRGKDRNYKADKERAWRPWPDAEDLEAMGITEISPEMQARITEVLEMSRNDQEQKLKRLDTVADKLIADDYQYSSTYPAEKLATANGYGGRYGEEGDSWGNDRPRASRTGIHVFRVRIGEDATKDTGGPDEVHIIGKHTPVASLSIETHRNAGPQPTSAQDTWAGWLAEVVEADKKRRNSTPDAPQRTGMASRSSKASAKRITKNFKVNGKPRPKPENRQEFVTRSVPTSASDLMRIIDESPYMKGKKSSEEIFDLINRMEIDWPAQEKLALKLEKVLADSPGFEELLGEYDIPMMLITKNGAAKSPLGYTDTLYQNRERWNFIEGEYMPQHGFIAFPARVVNQETVHNAVSDGPLPTDDIIRHELSHTIHAMAMARSRKARKAYEKDTAEFVAGMEEAMDMAEQSGADSFNLNSYSPLSPEDYRLAGEISRYAQTKRSEYIAELLTHMLPGKKTKFVLPKDEHYAMLSEFLDIPVARLRELANKSFNARTGWL